MVPVGTGVRVGMLNREAVKVALIGRDPAQSSDYDSIWEERDMAIEVCFEVYNRVLLAEILKVKTECFAAVATDPGTQATDAVDSGGGTSFGSAGISASASPSASDTNIGVAGGVSENAMAAVPSPPLKGILKPSRQRPTLRAS